MEWFIILLAIYGVLIPIGVAFWRYSYLEREAKLLLFMLLPVAANQLISEWWLYYVNFNNLPFYHMFIIIEFSFISLIYYSYLKKHRYRKIIPIVSVGFILFYLTSIVWNPDKIWVYSTYERAIEGGIILLFVGAYFIDVYRKEEIMYLQKTSGFWIGGGLILYFTSNLLLFAFSELVFSQESSVFKSIWVIHAILTILLYISYSIAFLCKKTETTL
ncbi:MAG: hypothetical protein ACJA1C_000819 [Crocinitomicaceae bacterium]|jgi:hypothetical protein